MEKYSKESRKRKRVSSKSRQSSLSTNSTRPQAIADTDGESTAEFDAANDGSANSPPTVTTRERSSSIASATVLTKRRKSSRFFPSLYSSGSSSSNNNTSNSFNNSASAATSRRSSAVAQQQSDSSSSLSNQNSATVKHNSDDNNNNQSCSITSIGNNSSFINNDKKSASSQKSSKFFSTSRNKLFHSSGNSSSISKTVAAAKRRTGSSTTVNDEDNLEPSNLSATHSTGSSRQLLSLLDYFPSFESSRRLTRSLTRRLRSSVAAGENLEASSTVTDPANLQLASSVAEASKRTSGQTESMADSHRNNKHTKETNSKDHNSPMEKQESGASSSSKEVTQQMPSKSSAQSAKASAQKVPLDYNVNVADYENSSNDSLNDGAGRLQQIIESHRSNIPIHIFGALGPRMQNLLGRGGSSGGGRWESLLIAMQKHDDLSAQLQGLIELCNQLVMSNEESVGTNFPIKEMVRCLIKLLQVEHNFDITTHACRALTYLMEALPRVTIHVTDAIPYLLEKLQRVECVDVAEQSLAALELLSRRHGKNILNAGGISACLQYIDFFSTSSQRSALQIVANCCLHMSGDDFVHLTDSLPALSQRLSSQDKKAVEILCQIFTRLVDNYVNDAEKLKRLSEFGLLENMQQLIVMSPPLLSSTALCSVVRMLQLLCRQCSEIAVRLLQMNIVTSLCILLVGTVDAQAANSELLARTSHELYEIVLLIGELWPALPNDGLFEVDAWLKSTAFSNEHILWTWRDEKGLWRPYMHVDNRILETAYQSKEEEVSLSTMGQTFTIDLLNMLQINEETGLSQPVQRRVASSFSPSSKKGGNSKQSVQCIVDARSELLTIQLKLYNEFFRSTFSVLYEIYTTGGGPTVRTECLRTLLRMIYHTDAETTKDVLKKHSISSLIAGILNSQDLKTVVPALQLARVLIDKQQEIFTVHFKREGVTHQLQKLSIGSVQFSQPTAGTVTSVSHSGIPPSSSYIVVTNTAGASSTIGYHQHHYIPNTVAGIQSSSHHQIIPGSSTVYSNHDLSYYAAAAAAAAAAVSVSNSRPTSGQPAAPSALGLNAFSTAGSSLPFAPAYLAHQQPQAQPHATSSSGAVPKRSSVASSNDVSGFKVAHSSSIKKRNPPSGATKHASFGEDRPKSSRIRGRGATSEGSTSKIATTTSSTTSSHHSYASGVSQAVQQHNQTMPSTSTGANTFLSSSFLSNLSLPRWAKPASYTRHTNNSPATKSTVHTAPTPPVTSTSTSSSMAQSVTSNSFNIVKATSWVKEQAKSIIAKYFPGGEGTAGSEDNEEVLLNKLCCISKALKHGEVECLDELAVILSSDVSCFEILQSNLIPSLIDFFTTENIGSNINLDGRLRHACEALFRAKVELNVEGVPVATLAVDQSLARNFVQKLNTCASQLEQLPVKVHDFAFGQSGGALRGLNALRFLHTQQIKCLLQRHPGEKMLKQWRRGPIKVDPLAQVSTIERYLVARGFGRSKSTSNEEICSEEENDSSGEDSDETTVRQGSSSEAADGGLHRLYLSINDKILPPDLSVYQAVRQFGTRLNDPLGGNVDWLGPEIWVNTHTIHYRLAADTKFGENSIVENKAKQGGAKNRAKDKAHLKPAIDPKDTEFKPAINPLSQYLQPKLPVDHNDPCFECLNLLRIVFYLSRYWWTAFKDALINDYSPALLMTDFYNAKIAGKISRQLQDPLMLIAGQMPSWIERLALSCPFICTFEIRMALFHVLALDRDRALQRLLDNFFDTSHSSTSERLTPRLERRKMIISREDILRQAETVLSNIENSRAVLEVQYENEVGTGLGPTLEFYALVSKNLQKANLQLWRGESIKTKDNDDNLEDYISSNRGLYPLALGRHIKQAQLDKIKTKFKLIGKLLARALLDGRILDLPLSPAFYKWFLRDEISMDISDLSDLDPTLSKSLQYLVGQLHKSCFGGSKYLEAKSAIEHLELDFTVPGNTSVELIKAGKDTPVSLENVQQYVDLVTHWLLRAGVNRQMEIMRDAFDSVLSLKHLKLFLPEEMDQLFCGAKNDVEPWDPLMLRQMIHPDHGYTHDSPQINWLIQILSEYDEQHRRLFLQFITGSPRLPVGGLKNLNPPFTAVRKHDGGHSADSHLPSVMTCVNYLKLPEYSTKPIMAQRLLTAITCGCFSFHLS